MATPDTDTLRRFAVWIGLLLVILLPFVAATQSPLLAYRSAVYITGGFAGIAAMALLLLQPLLAAGLLPGLSRLRARRVHRITGALLVLAVAGHVAALWRTSPPDMIDALLFRAPTAFSVFGVIAMWAALAAALLATRRRRLRPHLWRRLHVALALLIVSGSLIHALLITGTMESVTKALLCLATLAATGWALWRLRK